MTKTAKKLNRNGKDILEAIENLKAIGNHNFLTGNCDLKFNLMNLKAIGNHNFPNRTLQFEVQPDESYLL